MQMQMQVSKSTTLHWQEFFGLPIYLGLENGHIGKSSQDVANGPRHVLFGSRPSILDLLSGGSDPLVRQQLRDRRHCQTQGVPIQPKWQHHSFQGHPEFDVLQTRPLIAVAFLSKVLIDDVAERTTVAWWEGHYELSELSLFLLPFIATRSSRAQNNFYVVVKQMHFHNPNKKYSTISITAVSNAI